MKKLFVLIVLAVIAVLGVNFGLNFSKHTSAEQNHLPVIPKSSESKTAEPSVAQVEVGVPEQIKIPKINLNANVEQVGLDAKRAMDVPKEADNVGWYDLGAKPGEVGNAVIDGHLDKATGAPAVFWNVSKLEKGDSIVVEDTKGVEYKFVVTKTAEYPYDNFPLEDVFGSTDKRMLNLISCNGKWNSETHNYSHRTVVYSELVK